MSRRGDGSASAEHAEVILGADGWTAKTRVPMTTSRGRLVTWEQRWERSADGWSILDERQVLR